MCDLCFARLGADARIRRLELPEQIRSDLDSNVIRDGASSRKFLGESDDERQQHNERPAVVGPPRVAARMLAAGANMARVSCALGQSPVTARRYATIFAAGGVDALLVLGDVGRQSRLSVEALELLMRAIRQAPGQVGMQGECWTNALVQQFIEQEFSISYSYSHINRLIRDHGHQHWLRQSQK